MTELASASRKGIYKIVLVHPRGNVNSIGSIAEGDFHVARSELTKGSIFWEALW